jgi:lipopolysaccharide export system protein LptC
MRASRALTLLALALLAGATFWLLHAVKPPTLEHQAPPSHTPDYYFIDSTTTKLNQNGKPLYTLYADRVEHHPDDDSITLTNIVLDYYAATGPPWHVTADRGRVPKGNKIVHLKGHVHVIRRPEAGGQAVHIYSPTMTVLVDPRIATTRAPVRIVRGKSTTTAVGMKAYMKQNRVQLESQVKTHYVH